MTISLASFFFYLLAWYFGSRYLAAHMNLWKLKNFLLGWQYAFIIDCNQPHVIRMKKQPDGSWHGKLLYRDIMITEEGISGGYNITKAQALTSKIYFPEVRQTASANVINFEKYRSIK